jgi:SAM-dependent methyltransferase
MNNYDFCRLFAGRRPGATVLDFGCGTGQSVRDLRANGVQAFGCDPICESAAEFLVGMPDNKIPFPDATFDVVTANQVMEHVKDLTLALSEINRVLKPGGLLLSMFPHHGVWREAHTSVPFLHWFKPGKARFNYARVALSLGCGRDQCERPLRIWARDVCNDLERSTYYRTLNDIAAAYRRHRLVPQHIEHDWFDSRAPQSLQGFVPRAIKVWFVRRFAGLVFFSTKPELISSTSASPG